MTLDLQMVSVSLSERQSLSQLFFDYLSKHSRTIGELFSGPITDLILQRARRRALNQGEVAPIEVRLRGIWTGALTVPAGLLMCVVFIF